MKYLFILFILLVSCSKENPVENKNASISNGLSVSSLNVGNGYPYMIDAQNGKIVFTELSTGITSTISGIGGDFTYSTSLNPDRVFSLNRLLSTVDSLKQEIKELKNKN